jgi:hypothetical protein
MTNPIDYDYFEWLVAQIEIANTKTYDELFERMHNTEFVWMVPNDDNRVQDGLDLRTEFLNENHKKYATKILVVDIVFKKGVSMLEVVVSLSRRVAFTAGGAPRNWAWNLIDNAQLRKMFDPLTDQKREKIEEILEALIWRTYKYDGQGGFFPLNYPKEDQTKVEIWYQMNAYVNEIQEF